MLAYIWHIFQAGGLVMYPLIGFLIFSWTIGIDRIRTYRQFDKEMAGFGEALKGIRDSKEGMKILAENLAATQDTNDFNKLVYPVIVRSKTHAVLENRLEEVISYIDCVLKRGLHWLSMIVTMSTLLGLLGTVLGMIRSFNAIGGAVGAPTVITGGVGEALIATATGLTVAIVALAFHSYCANQVNKFVSHLEYQAGIIIDTFNGSEEQ